MFCNLATDHFSGKFFSGCTPLGPTGSNNSGLMFVWPQGTESIAYTTGHTHNKDIII